MFFGVGASTLNKWFKTSGAGPSLVVEAIAPVITALIALHHVPGSSGCIRANILNPLGSPSPFLESQVIELHVQ